MSSTITAGSAEEDRAILATLYHATDGESWKKNDGWDTDANIGDWHGVSVDVDNRVVGLELGLNNLRGGIPKELGGLPALEWLALDKNILSGEIPKELGNLQTVGTISLFNNALTGEIPTELGNLQAIRVLDLRWNQLTGGIPKELGGLPAMKELILGWNQLSGEIPTELGNLQAIQVLDLGGNQLTGSVPSELKKMAPRDLDLRFNKLTSLGKVEDALDLVQRFIADYRAVAAYETLHLNGNPWIMPPEAVVEEGLSAVESYLEDVRTAEKAGVGIKTMQLLKVVLVGSSQAGKTSLMDSIVAGEAKATEGTPEEVGTIGIQLQRHPLKGVRVEFYDCAGQIDYKGMHQIFVTRRALYLLVWDVKKCQGKASSTIDEVIEADIMPWLYALHLRAPDSTVILVANKCDGSLQTFSKTVQTVRTRVKERLAAWNDSRGFTSQRASRVSTLNVLAETSKVSCQDGVGLAELIDVVTAQSCTSMSVPPSWDLALVVLGAMRDKKAPLKSARDHISMCSSSPTHHWEDGPSDLYIPKNALTRQWNQVVGALTESGDLQSTALGRASVLNPDSALEGSLWISEFAGQLLRVDGGDGIFLDVGLLSEVLNPIVDHKLEWKVFTEHELNASKYTLVSRGVLTPHFARHLWGNVFLKHGPQSSSTRTTAKLESALFDVIIKLGLAFPLGPVPLPDDSDGTPSVAPQSGGISSQRDMLVWRWLPERLSDHGKATFETLVDNLEDGEREVTLNWEFDSAGAPHGLMERLIALCHVIGEAEEAWCWRTGAVFKSPRITGAPQPPSYVVKISYSNTEKVLSVTMFGSLKSDREWAALRFVASLMVNVSKDWPGALWAGWVKCADHPRVRLQLAAPTETRIGAPLIPPTSVSCACRGDKGTVMGQTVARLGNVINTKTDRWPGDLFEDLAEEEETEEESEEEEVGEEEEKEEEVGDVAAEEEKEEEEVGDVAAEEEKEEEVGDVAAEEEKEEEKVGDVAAEEKKEEEGVGDVSAEEEKEGEEDGEEEGSWHACCGDAFSMWRPHARQTAAACLTSAFGLFVIVLVEDLSATRTFVLVGVIVLLAGGACAATCVAFRQERAERQLDVDVV